MPMLSTRRTSIAKTALAATLMLWAVHCDKCGSSSGSGDVGQIDDKPWTAPTLAEADREAVLEVGKNLNAFAVDLYGKLRSRPGNFSFSPASIGVALAMTLGGTKGQTADELRRVVHLALKGRRLHRTIAAMIGHWTSPRDPLASASQYVRSHKKEQRNYFFELSIANRTFGQSGLTIQPSFVELTGKLYGAPIQSLDFQNAPEAARQQINRWVAGRTKDRVLKLIPKGAITPDTRFALVNAMYFTAGWHHPFMTSLTQDGKFMADGNRPVRVKMMGGGPSAGYAHHQNDKLKVLELHFIDNDFSMVFLLPDENDGLPGLEQKLTIAALERWLKVASHGKVLVTIPKFRLKAGSSMKLKKPLSELGLKALFSQTACDLTGLARTKPPLFVGEVFHQSFVAINEDGAEAAAATAVLPKAGSAPGRSEPPSFTADHPFLFLIRDRKTGTILFLGRVTDPPT